MRVMIALAGLHRVHRGAEVALESVGRGLAERGHEVTLLGTGAARSDDPYRFLHAPAVARERLERLPHMPVLRDEFAWEDLTFMPGALARYRPRDFDVALTCGFPFPHWMLRRPTRHAPKQVFVTQNGDWPAKVNHAEYRFFRCDGLVCTNPEYFARNERQWPSVLIPNGVDTGRFSVGPSDRSNLGLPEGVPLVLMVSALMTSKRVDAAIRAMAEVTTDAHLVVAGDGPQRGEIVALANELIPGRFHRLTLPFAQMPDLYRSVDVFVHTTERESFGNVYIEALVSGLPIVAHDSDLTRWILGDEEFLVDTTNHTLLAKAIDEALAGGPTPPDRARQGAERFGWPTIVDQYEAFLTEVVGS